MKNISKLLAAVLLIVMSFNISFAQDETAKVLDSISLKMFKDMNNKDYEAIIDMTHPKVFEIVPKENMLELIKSMFEGNEEFSIEIPNETPKYKVSEMYRDEESKTDFAFTSYDLKMKMTFNQQDFGEEEKEMMVKMMKIQDMDVKFISNNTLDVLMKNRLTILLKNEETNNNWSMLNYDQNSPLFFQLVATGVIEKSKEYHQNLMLENKKNEENEKN